MLVEEILPCPKCGFLLNQEDNFCPQCGNKVRKKMKHMSTDYLQAKGEHDSFNSHPSLLSLMLEAVKGALSPSSVSQPPSRAVYSKRPLRPMGRYLLAAVGLILAGLFMGYGRTWIAYIGYTIAGFTAPVGYLLWMIRSDRFEQEPVSIVILTFGWGVFCGVLASVLNLLVFPILGAPGASLVEEPLKLLGAYWVARHRRLGSEFNDHLDGMVYGASAGAGFAGLENLYYILEMIQGRGIPALGAIAIRSTTSFCHIVWSASAGRSLGLAKAMRGHTLWRDLIPGLAVAIPMHFLWNASPPLISLLLLFPIYAVILIRQVKAAQRDEERWGYPEEAPVE
jgi:RsiW-degrading membrane proteinase PrsW (M82 family)